MGEAGLRRGRCLVVTDENVGALYADALLDALADARWEPRLVTLPAGETTKAYEHLHTIYDEALGWGIDRKTPVLALGGGVVGDLAGFAAATLLRGVPLVQLPTSLIAQVDSAIGGKTGINHRTGKNLIGAFYQPAFVCADVRTLESLPDREWTSGLAEVVKHALIADPGLYDFLEGSWPAVLERAPEVVPETVYRAAAIKAGVVSEDEREQGRRAILNFGHTFGHAIERVAGYGVFTHGEAVALGMRAALHLSHQLNPSLPLERINDLILHLPTPPHLGDLSTERLMAAMKTDKKVDAGVLRLVLLHRLGEAYVTPPPPSADIIAAWDYAKQRPFGET
jgi:3-dehydroquinate synthase